MNEMIRTGILHVPQIDEDAGQAVLSILQQSTAHLLLLLEQAVPSQRNMVEERLRSWCDVGRTGPDRHHRRHLSRTRSGLCRDRAGGDAGCGRTPPARLGRVHAGDSR